MNNTNLINGFKAELVRQEITIQIFIKKTWCAIDGSDVNRPAKTARPGLGRFGPSHFGLAQARPQPGQVGPDFFFFAFFLH